MYNRIPIAALILLSVITTAQGQITGSTTCTAGLGQFIVNETFGTGTGVGPALKPGITNLQYVTIPCPNDGQYTIVNSTSGCWTGNWHTTRDHTGDPNGYFMLINASVQPSDFYTQTVTGLCAGSTYLFSAWVMNMDVSTGTLADISFTVETTTGIILGSYDTRGIPLSAAASWRQYGFYFTVPAGASTVVLRMHNNAPGGLGNDLALDDIVFVPAGPATAISINGVAGSSATACGGNLELLSTVESCFLTNAYQWQSSTDGGLTWSDIPGATNSTFNMTTQPPGTRQYRLNVAQVGNMGSTNCRVNSNVLTITITPAISYGIRASKTEICAGDSVLLTAYGGDTYLWSPAAGVASPTVATTWVFPKKTTPYSVAMTSINGCPPTDGESVTIVVDPAPSVSVSKSNDLDCSIHSALLQASGGGSYAWSPAVSLDRADIPNPTASPVATTKYYVLVTSGKGCVSKDSVTVVVSGVPASYGLKASKMEICSGDSVLLTAYGGDSYQWAPVGSVASPSSAATWAFPTATTSYTVSMSSSNGCPPTGGKTVTIVVDPLPELSVSKSNDLDCTEGSAQLYASGGDSYAWSPAASLDHANVQAPVASPRTTTTYYVKVTSDKGCSLEDSINVVVNAVSRPGAYMLPSAFSPNNDGHNDVFGVRNWAGVVELRLTVYDRWGKVVFYTTNPSVSWDGTTKGEPMPAGTYVYEVVARTYCGRIEHKGTVVLIR